MTAAALSHEMAALDRLLQAYVRPNGVLMHVGRFVRHAALAMAAHAERMNGTLWLVPSHAEGAASLDGAGLPHDSVHVRRIENAADDARDLVADASADLLFIGAGGDARDMRNTILDWHPKLRRCGVICGNGLETSFDECTPGEVLGDGGEQRFAVLRSVAELFPDPATEAGLWHAEKTYDANPILDDAVRIRHQPHYERSATIFKQLLQTATPRLMEEEYRGFNILLYMRQWYALRSDQGRLDLPTIDRAELQRLQRTRAAFVARSRDEVKALVDGID